MKNFKLLAIRPLNEEINSIQHSCRKNILKGLQDNFIYRFYSDYIFLDKDRNEIANTTEYTDVQIIKHKRSVPDDFYGDNINICAVVGKNGSGKSSLLELFYYFLYEYSLYERLLNHQSITSEYTKEFFIEFYYQLDDCIYCLKWNSTHKFTKISYIKDHKNKNLYIKDFSNIELSENRSSSYKIPIYTIVTNYSIYGLNSSSDQDRWLDRLFIKNDGYQTPIVLTPYREDGNININSEFELANSRLLKVFLLSSEENEIKTSALIRDLSIQKLLFKLDIKKNLNIYFNDKTYELEDVVSQFELINSYRNELFFNKLYTFFKKKIIYRELIYSYSKIDFQDSHKFMHQCFNLSNLYIFKKIIKIVFNYKNYKGFKPLFNDFKIGNLQSNNNLVDIFIGNYVKFFSPSGSNLNLIQFVELTKQNIYEVDKMFLKNIDLIKRNILKYYYNFYDEAVINNEYEKSCQYIYKKSVSVFEIINSFLDDFNEKLASTNFREIYISNLLSRLSLDSSHVTLKLRQVLNMQESNFFNYLTISDQKNFSEKDDNVYYTVNKNYFDQVKLLTDEEIPNAFFEALFFFRKANFNSDFELKYLSSGEQQLLHSFISLLYHIDNILSVVENEEANTNSDSKILTYKAINIILDEIELYYHPEYQRIYIDSLLVLLKQKKYKKLNFNIIFSTHSPFILSDIPNQNILKLKNGEPDYCKNSTNSFGANIHDLLADEFFLENGFMGEFASKKIQKIFKTISSDKLVINIENYESLIQEINIIGEHLLRKPLLEMLDKKFQEYLDNKTLIEFYQKRINELSK
ncbi:ATP-binding protein [Chryseobacterium taiwanense]|uniref:ATPase AAA-type core domain-containing protein n=1 Tax=Chryseobacterium taiwanense TaxID=363331 RepID=A0A0B4DAJ6_9FLAO|nr:ATP-binding protein [Chryseobacterium taiwanense]KIC61335.1 hypothetical protein RM51_17815 [Chryseobacterium taiwanense]